MNDRTATRIARMAALLNNEGSITPSENLPAGLLVESKDIEEDYLRALVADNIGQGLHYVRKESGFRTQELLERRNISKGRLSQLENPSLNPRVSSITEQANALEYDVSLVFTPRNPGMRAVHVPMNPQDD